MNTTNDNNSKMMYEMTISRRVQELFPSDLMVYSNVIL